MSSNFTDALQTIAELQSQLAAMESATEDPCASSQIGRYDQGFQIGGIFVILVASLLGVMSTLLGHHCPRLSLPLLATAVGKALGTGIILSCALIHMLQPAAESFSSPCVPKDINTDYPAYAYLFAMLAALGMYTLDYTLGHLHIYQSEPSPVNGIVMIREKEQSLEEGVNGRQQKGEDSIFRRVIDASSTELGLAIHSVIIGITTSMVSDESVHALITALTFHQLFEGMGLGSRLASKSIGLTGLALAVFFSMSAPAGQVAGVVLMSKGGINTNGQVFLLTQGTLDAICAGILLYIGFSMLNEDFRNDLKRVDTVGKLLLFFGLWGGAGGMATIGRWL